MFGLGERPAKVFSKYRQSFQSAFEVSHQLNLISLKWTIHGKSIKKLNWIRLSKYHLPFFHLSLGIRLSCFFVVFSNDFLVAGMCLSTTLLVRLFVYFAWYCERAMRNIVDNYNHHFEGKKVRHTKRNEWTSHTYMSVNSGWWLMEMYNLQVFALNHLSVLAVAMYTLYNATASKCALCVFWFFV